MHQDNALSRTVGTIYDAALDAALWPDVLATGADYVGGKSAGLLSTETGSKVCTVHHQFGFDQHYVDLYRNEYWQYDPVAPSPLLPVERLASVSDYLSDDEFRAGRFWQEWMEPQGWMDGTSVVLERSATTCSTFVVARDETRGFADDKMNARMRIVAPHFRRAVAIARTIGHSQAEAATFAEVFDGLSSAVFLIDASGRIVHANVAGRSMLAANDFLYAVRDRLVARNMAADRALHAEFAGSASGDIAGGMGAIAVPLTSRDDELYVAHVLPLSSESRTRGTIANTAIAALFVRKATVETPSLPESIARHYKLTPTELRVLLAIVEVGGGPEVADALGIADSTVKTHLGRVYQKTGTHRQTDLVKFVTGFSTPLLS